MSRCCQGICVRYPRLAPNYRDGKKCCRHCGFFLVTEKILCPCCKYPLAVRGRANQTQLARRAEKSRQLVSMCQSKILVTEVRQNWHSEGVLMKWQ